MSDTVIKYKGRLIGKNGLGYRVLFISNSPVFSSLKKVKNWIKNRGKV